MDWKEIDNRLQARGVRRECPMCDSVEWNAGDRGLLLVSFDKGTLHLDPAAGAVQGVECASVTCANCGFVRLHSLEVLGEAQSLIDSQ
jgi:hypothetical protein